MKICTVARYSCSVVFVRTYLMPSPLMIDLKMLLVWVEVKCTFW